MDILNNFYNLIPAEYTAFYLGFAVLAILYFGYKGFPLWAWTILVAGVMILLKAPIVALGIFLGLAVIMNTPIRKTLLSGPILKFMRNSGFLPQISQTEREALEAGVVWIESDLFSGKPDWDKIMAEPFPKLTAEEEAFLDGPCEEFCNMISDWDVHQTRDFSPEQWDYLKKNKFWGMIIPKKFGGLEFSAYASARVLGKISSRSLPACVTVMVPNSLGPAELLLHYGKKEQQDKWLPKLAVGEEVPCFALTEPQAGSDAGSITSNGVLFKGEDGKIKIKLNWNKRWITLAAISTVMGMAFKLRDPENLLGKGEDLGITCALIPSKTPGVILGRRHDPLGVPFYNCPTQGLDVVVDAEEAIIGGIEQAGKGWLMLMESLGAGRGISLPGQATGGMKMLSRITGDHAVVRKQFGLSIGKFEGIEDPLAKIGGYTYLIDAMSKFTVAALDKGVKPPVITAIAKLQSTEMGRLGINHAMDILGGSGISMGPHNLIANTYIAAPIAITVEGANILTRTLMIFGQGALRAHPYAFKEINAAEKGDVNAFDNAFWGHIGHVFTNVFRTIVLGLTRGYVASRGTGGEVGRYYQKLSWASAKFAILSDLAMALLGGKLKQAEKITGRFADILSWMYMMTCVLRKYEADGRPKEDFIFVKWSMKVGFSNIQRAFQGILSNMNVPGLRWLFGGVFALWNGINSMAEDVSDNLTHKIAGVLLSDSAQRDRLTDGIYIPNNPEEQLYRLERAHKLTIKAEAAERKVRQAIRKKLLPKKKVPLLIEEALEKGIITAEDKKCLTESVEARWQTIQVDDFSQEEYVERRPGKSETSEPLNLSTDATKQTAG